MPARLPGYLVASCIMLPLFLSYSTLRAETGEIPPRVDASYPNAAPPYPDGAQANGEQGTVLVDVWVRSNGVAGKAKIAQSSGFNDLDTAAVQGVLNWRFIPARRGPNTAADWTTVKIVYQLPAPPPPVPAKWGP